MHPIKQQAERRRHRRKTIRLNAESIAGDTDFSVFIENLSESGISMITAPSDIPKDLSPGQRVTIKFILSTGILLKLQCMVVWSHRTAPRSPAYSIGMEIVNPPEAYITFIRTLP